MNFGDIIYLKNIVFKNKDGSHEIDPYFSIGRPCIFIGCKDDKMYIFPLRGFKPKHKYLFILNPNEENKLKKVSTISIKNIFELPIQSFQTIGNINEKKMLSIIKNFILYYDNEYDNINNKEICDRVYCIFNEILLLSKGRKVRKIKKIIKK